MGQIYCFTLWFPKHTDYEYSLSPPDWFINAYQSGTFQFIFKFQRMLSIAVNQNALTVYLNLNLSLKSQSLSENMCELMTFCIFIPHISHLHTFFDLCFIGQRSESFTRSFDQPSSSCWTKDSFYYVIFPFEFYSPWEEIEFDFFPPLKRDWEEAGIEVKESHARPSQLNECVIACNCSGLSCTSWTEVKAAWVMFVELKRYSAVCLASLCV